MAENLASRYRPHTFQDVVEQSVVIDIVKNIVTSGTLSSRNFLFIGPAGVGKAQPMYSKVLTPQGFIEMRNVKQGTHVITRNGNVACVSGVYPQGTRPVYEITLQDRTKIRVADNHLNVVYRYNEDRKQREEFVLTTLELIDLFNTSRFKLRIDTPEVRTFNQSTQLPIDPYLLGCLIGDGSLSNNFQFCNSEQDIIDKVDSILRRDYNYYLQKLPGDNVDWSISPIYSYKYKMLYNSEEYTSLHVLKCKLVQDGYDEISEDTIVRIAKQHTSTKYPDLVNEIVLLEENPDYNINKLYRQLASFNLLTKSIHKHIPKSYLLADREARIALLQGLYDTDGYTDETGSTTFTTSSPQLSEDFAFLVRSLGIRDTVSKSKAGYKNSDNEYVKCNDVYNHLLHMPHDFPYCTSKKHLMRYKNRQHHIIRNIVSIEYIGQEECQCIYVDDPDHTYISDGFIPTHNTTTCRIIASALGVKGGELIELDGASHGGVDSIREIIAQARMYPVGSPYKVIIIDECFHKDSIVATSEGDKRIADIQIGDTVLNLAGFGKVVNTFENRVESSNLTLVHLNGQDILTTRDHLFMTRYGWVKAAELKEGDKLYANSDEVLHDMRKGIRELSIGQSESMQQNMWGDTTETAIRRVSDESSENWLHEIVSNLRKGILYSQEHQRIDLFEEVCNYIKEAARTFGEAACCYAEAQTLIYMSRLWERNVGNEFGAQEVLLSKMPRSLEASASSAEKDQVLECLQGLWNNISSETSWNSNMLEEVHQYVDKCYTERCASSRIFNSDEEEKSDVRSKVHREDVSNERQKWDFAHAICYAWWKWFLHTTTNTTLPNIGPYVDIRISCEDSCKEERQSDALSYKLQSRPRTTGYSASSRSGWCRSQYEIAKVARSEERGVFNSIRVESVEIYQPGYNEQSFSGYFEDTELRSGYVTMYDLEVEGHSSYFVNGVLVHNCHAISQNSWATLLKTLEEQPAKTIFMLATTNPEKIPPTIISRVQTFQLSKISLNGIFNRLKYIIEQENALGRNITYTDDAILYISKMAKGGMRDAITTCEKAIAFSNELTIENLQKALGLPKYDDYFDLLNAIAKKDNAKIVEIINTVYNSGVNFTKWFDEFFSFITNIVKYIYLQDINQTMIPSIYQDKIRGYGTAHSALCLKLSNKLAKMNQELKTTQYLQEVAISYLCSVPTAKK